MHGCFILTQFQYTICMFETQSMHHKQVLLQKKEGLFIYGPRFQCEIAFQAQNISGRFYDLTLTNFGPDFQAKISGQMNVYWTKV